MQIEDEDHPLAGQIQARHISTPFASVVTVDLNESLAVAQKRMEIAGISTAPVVNGGQVVAVFTLEHSTRAISVAGAARPLSRDLVMSEQTGLAELTFGLEREPFVLLLAGREISGVVTRADLGKPAARTYFYLLLAELEMELAQALRYLDLYDDVILRLWVPNRERGPSD